MYGGSEMHSDFQSESLKGRRHLACVGVDGRTIIKRILKEAVCECVDWTQLFQFRGSWWDYSNTVMNLRVRWGVCDQLGDY
jgi:hypothetical protein